VIPEECLYPVVNVVRQTETGECIEDSTVTDAIKCLGEIQCIDDDIWIALKMICDGVEEVYKGCCCGCTGLKGKLVGET